MSNYNVDEFSLVFYYLNLNQVQKIYYFFYKKH